MIIAFLGNHVQHSSEWQYCRTLEAMGHSIVRLQEGSDTLNSIIHKSLGANLFVFVHTHGVVTTGILEVFNHFRMRGVPVTSWHLDLYMGLQREHEIHEDYFKVDHFFTVDKLMAEYLSSHTQTKGHYLPPASFDELSYIGEPDYEKYPHEIVITAAKHYHPEYPYRAKLVDWLHATYGNRFAHYGSGGRPQVRGHELNRLYASAKVVIGDTLCKNFDYPWYFSDRLTSCLGQGAFMIFPYIKGLENMYKIGSEIVPYQYDNFNELKFLIDLFLNESMQDRRIEIRNAGHERTKKEHLFSHRWETILKTVFP